MLDFKKLSRKNICFIGLMGSGKSVIGKELASYYKLSFFDSDYEIEKSTGNKINQIFKNHGELYFREIEEKVCEKLLTLENVVIALGGGSILSKKTRNLIKMNSYSIYVEVDINILEKRLKYSKKRPLLQNVNKKNKLNDLLSERLIYYNMANLKIKNNFDKKNILNDIKLELNT